ncbi:pyridoxamine 5'-phosphate oxidase [Cyanobium sp. Morenito 9A2]|uniref:pyridoxamine 5'-phosphate oxidase n=1 Tax=Cyanobium sp. Morenito 9A2 TaxID=2823718 RepID=UPI0020CF13CD|nr:pyridoxamine 5'-phosphate oxidase [Cyanobium sp. Morenito 9A2]MCP9848952.1 pyridoxamine 5'-phosphate oxidase [Cyanobium sp. Morenito 9A2]
MDQAASAASANATSGEVASLRREYRLAGLRRSDLAADPVAQFRRWLSEATAAELPEPNALVLSSSDGLRCSSRTVLLKAFDGRGFVFFTNYGSRKARDIAACPQVSLLFPWYALERQVGVIGRAERISVGESLAFFASRPQGSRLGAWVSQQSAVINSRTLLELKWEEMRRKFAGGEVPLPDFWGGFRVVPREVEFWQGRENRLHDRLRYVRSTTGEPWLIERLAP